MNFLENPIQGRMGFSRNFIVGNFLFVWDNSVFYTHYFGKNQFLIESHDRILIGDCDSPISYHRAVYGIFQEVHGRNLVFQKDNSVFCVDHFGQTRFSIGRRNRI